MKMDPPAFAKARTFIYENARLIDRRRFEFHFEAGPREAVFQALKPYQNPDGGFGQALEPDIRCPESQPVPTEMALHIMDEVGGFDPEILAGVLTYLGSIRRPGGGLPRIFRSVNAYPHAPWWTTDDDTQPSLNPTGSLVALFLKHQVAAGPWLDEAVEFCLGQLETVDRTSYHDLIQLVDLLTYLPDRARAAELLERLDPWLTAPGVIVTDPEVQGYVHRFYDWAPTPDSYCAKFFDQPTIEAQLAHLMAQQAPDGGWPISWPALSPANEMEWRGWVTVNRLKTLQAYGLI